MTVEYLKFRRSVVVWAATALVVVLIPLMCVAFLEIASGGGSGAAALKAQAMVVGEGWEAYLGLLGQMAAVAMFIGPGVVVAWAFGREHVDRTFPSLFALPVSRRSIATAKFVVLAGWGLGLTVLFLAAAVVAGLVASIGPITDVALLPALARLGVAGFLTSLLALTLALAASAGRGYLPAMGALILLTMFAQISVLFGTGGWFPYAAPGLYAVGGAQGIPEVSMLQLLLVPIMVAVVVWATIRWWERASVV